MLTMVVIVSNGAPIVRTKRKIIDPIDDETVEQQKNMRQYLVNTQNTKKREEYGLRPGVGLAAPQIGLDKRVLAIYVEDEDGNAEYDYMLINPKVKSHSVTETYLPNGEGCLSVDEDIEGIVQRKKRIKVEAQTIEGKTIEIKANGFLAVVLQHELDHLYGIMFYDHIDKDHALEASKKTKPIE